MMSTLRKQESILNVILSLHPISCEDVPAMDNIVAREGMEQRIVPTGMATRGNEIERHRNFSESIFREGRTSGGR